MDNLPIRFQVLLELTQLGIPLQSIGFQTLTLQSDKYICARELQPGTNTANNVIIVDVATKQVEKRPIKADSAIINPLDRIIALKSGTLLQVFKLVAPQPQQVGSFTMKEAVEFWKWISATQIALVTAKAVYHWDLSTTDSQPQQVFARVANLNGHQIINYIVNWNSTWMCLVGIAQEGTRIVGHMQLHSTEKGVSHPLDGHAACFTTMGTGANKSTILCFCARNDANNSVLYIGEVGGKPTAHKVQAPVFFPPEGVNDFPVAMEASDKYKVVYLVTKEGYFHMYDLKLGKRITVNKISNETIFASCPHTFRRYCLC